MPPKCTPWGRLRWKTQSETIFARLSSKLAGLLPAQMGRLHDWESRGPRFISACKSSASRAPTRIPFRHSRLGITREPSFNLIDKATARESFEMTLLYSALLEWTRGKRSAVTFPRQVLLQIP